MTFIAQAHPQTPLKAITINNRIEECAAYNSNLGSVLLLYETKAAICNAAWFDAHQTEGNYHLYSMPTGFNFTAADVLVDSEGLDGMAVMVSWIGSFSNYQNTS